MKYSSKCHQILSQHLLKNILSLLKPNAKWFICLEIYDLWGCINQPFGVIASSGNIFVFGKVTYDFGGNSLALWEPEMLVGTWNINVCSKALFPEQSIWVPSDALKKMYMSCSFQCNLHDRAPNNSLTLANQVVFLENYTLLED